MALAFDRRRIGLVVTGGVVAGLLDITYACAYWAIKAGTPPTRIFQSVATGVLGKDAFGGGMASAALGLTLHMLIAMAMAFAYFAAARRLPLLWQRPVLMGAAYGLFLYLFMRFVVVPLSAAGGGGGGGGDLLWLGLSVAVHMFLVGVPIALFASRAVVK